MITIGIELNHVVRNINKQIIKYYIKENNLDVDIDEINDKENVLDTFAKFNSKYDKNRFIFIDYPYEIFGACPAVEKNLPRDITIWLNELSNIEEEEIRIVYYSLYEEALTIQSTFFFLSKTGTRVREVFFPKTIDEVWNRCDVVITANKDVLDKQVDGKQSVKIIGNGNKNDGSKGDYEYDSLTEVIKDESFIEKILKK